jgi:plasmid maintenance system antidote protein VapI
MEAYFTLKSISRNSGISFHSLRTRLVAVVNARLQNGEFTERGLAKLLGVSQPHVHNVLKGARTLQWDLADRLLLDLDIQMLDLWNDDELLREERIRNLPAQARAPADEAGTDWVTELIPKKQPGHEWKALRAARTNSSAAI